MEGLKKRAASQIRRESVDVKYLPADARDREVASLHHPWIAEEGPIQARFRCLDGMTEPLLPRGLAFDGRRTVTWDEDGVQVISPAEPEQEVVALQSSVVVRERFQGIPPLRRVDYLKSGVWLASRYFVAEDAAAEKAAGGETTHA